MIVQFCPDTPGGHAGGARGVLVTPSSTTAAEAATGASAVRPRIAVAETRKERFMFVIEHDAPAGVAVQRRQSMRPSRAAATYSFVTLTAFGPLGPASSSYET